MRIKEGQYECSYHLYCPFFIAHANLQIKERRYLMLKDQAKEPQVMPIGQKKMEDTQGEKLLAKAMKVFGINKIEHILSWRYDPEIDRVFLLTVGGHKTSYTVGDDVDRIPIERIDGISRKKSGRALTGAKAKVRK